MNYKTKKDKQTLFDANKIMKSFLDANADVELEIKKANLRQAKSSKYASEFFVNI